MGPLNKKQNRRKTIRKNKIYNKNLRCVGVNAAGLSSKLPSFDFILNSLKPSIFCLQETKLYRQGKIKTENTKNYTIFELNRKNSRGGGQAIGVLSELLPVWIAEGNDESEFLVVGFQLNIFYVRVICGYGPQLSDSNKRKEKFWTDIGHQVQDAQDNNAAVLMNMDSNSWLGKEIIPNDPN